MNEVMDPDCMNYFTPDLIAAYGSNDPAAWKEAEQRWDAACVRYNSHIESLKDEFPPSLRRLEDNYSLHDARIQGMGRRDGAFVIVLQLDKPPQPLLTLTYDLVEEQTIRQDALPPDHRSTAAQVEWEYDEIEKVAGQPPNWRQAILLSNGWEVTLHFRDVRVEEMQPLIPAPRYSTALPVPGLPHPA